MPANLTRIAVFYDGNFFLKISNYYTYTHERKARINIGGLHEFIRHELARQEGIEPKLCQIVDAHYFRGRLSAKDAEDRNTLYGERQFDEVLMREGIVAHYLPLGPYGEKGIDVWLALEAYELAIYKRFDVLVLVACDSDFLPLVRKLNALGTRVMLLGWNFKYMDADGEEQETKTSHLLMDEVTYPMKMDALIDQPSGNAVLIDGLFVAPSKGAAASQPERLPTKYRGKIFSLKEGYGFIAPEEGKNTIFFYHESVLNEDFNELRVNQGVEYILGKNEKGTCAENITVIE